MVTYNIICNNCVSGWFYKFIGIKHQNPFIWNVIMPKDMNLLYKNFGDIDFNNAYFMFDERMTNTEFNLKTIKTVIDNKLEIHYVHYIQNGLFSENSSNNKYLGNIFLGDVLNYAKKTYFERLARMDKDNIIFLVVQDPRWNTKDILEFACIHTGYKKIIITDDIIFKDMKTIDKNTKIIYVGKLHSAQSTANWLIKYQNEVLQQW